MTLVDAIGLGRMWDTTSGLRPVTFTVDAGEFLVVRGRSGSGKSTLLALLAGWCAPSCGTLTRSGPLAGDRWRRWEVLALVPQVLAPVGELSIAENVALPLRTIGVPWATAASRAAPLLSALDLEEQAARPPDAVSLGQLQRMALARAVVAEPALVLVDEPTSHQDAQSEERVLTVLRDVVERGGTCLVASHEARVAEAADRVLDLDAL